MNFDLNDRRSMSLVLIGGGLLLLGFWQYGIGLVWPLFIVGPGAVMLYHALNARTDDDIDMIFPGVIVTGTGLLLLYQSLSGHWESWAYAWAIYPPLTGFAMQWRAVRSRKYSSEYYTGQNMVRYGLIALVSMAVVFEFVIFNSGSAQVFGMGLVGLGVLLLLTSGKRKNATVDFGDLIKPKNDAKTKFSDEDAA